MDYEARPFSRGAFSDLLALVAHNARARWPAMTPMMTGDVAWQLPGSAPKDNLRLWYDGTGLAGYAWLQPPSIIKLDLRVGLPWDDGLADEMLGWAEQRRMGFEPGIPFYIELTSMEEWADRILHPPPTSSDEKRYLVSSAFESDAASLRFLERSRFEPTPHFEPFLVRDLDAIPDGELPDGLTLRHVEERDFENRVEVHRAAWWPATGFDLERYLQVRGVSSVFDPELDIVAESADGTFAAYCICWADPVSKVGFYEPVGTRPEWRGSGVSRAVLHEGLRRLKAKGMRFARIYTAGFNRPAFRLYQSCGFEPVDRSRTHIKAL